MGKHERLEWSRKKAGFASQYDAAAFLGVPRITYSTHEAGTRGFKLSEERYAKAFRVSLAWLSHGVGDAEANDEMPILGYVGAGGTVNIEHIDIDASTEMTPRPSGMPKDSIAFRVKGDSMRPMLRDNDLILCLPQKQDWQSLIGELCVVKTSENEVYIKELRKGYEEGTVRLISYNQLIDPIENVKPIWVSRVEVMVKVKK